MYESSTRCNSLAAHLWPLLSHSSTYSGAFTQSRPAWCVFRLKRKFNKLLLTSCPSQAVLAFRNSLDDFKAASDMSNSPADVFAIPRTESCAPKCSGNQCWCCDSQCAVSLKVEGWATKGNQVSKPGASLHSFKALGCHLTCADYSCWCCDDHCATRLKASGWSFEGSKATKKGAGMNNFEADLTRGGNVGHMVTIDE